MFGSNDKKQTDNKQSTNDPNDSAVALAPPEDALVTAPPDPVIAPTAPPLNDSLSASTDEPTLPPPEPTPSITSDYSKKAKDSDDGGLLDIKQQALQSLSPLVGHLDQTPEEKFKTTMMLIQASDNANLIKDAYDAANAISDEKIRAQALLDVVNEINYFTQNNTENSN